jgi:hypothetical protein
VRVIYITIVGLLALSVIDRHASANELNTALLDQPKAFWRELMKSVYGPYDKGKKCWIGRRGVERFCMRPHRMDKLTVKGNKTVFVVVGGSRIGEDGELEQAHPSTAAMGLMVLQDRNGVLSKAADNGLYEEFGSFGMLPPEEYFSVREIGPNETFGWAASSGWSGQGITTEWTTIYAAIGDKVTAIGGVPSHFDDSGNCEGGKHLMSGEPCTDYSFELMFDSAYQSQRFYPLILRLTGSRKGVQYNDSFVVRFDESKFGYEEVKGLPAGIDEDG